MGFHITLREPPGLCKKHPRSRVLCSVLRGNLGCSKRGSGRGNVDGEVWGGVLMRFELWAWEEKQAYEVGRWQRTRPGRIPQRMVETSLNCFRWGQDTIKFFILKWSSEGVWAFQGGASGKEPTCQCRRSTRCGFNPWVRKIPWRRAWQPTPVFLLRGAW